MMATEVQRRDIEKLPLHDVLHILSKTLWWMGMRSVFQRMIEVDLTLSEAVALLNLRQGSLSVADIAQCLFITHSAASRASDRLVRDGFVSRQENPEDRRQKYLTLTDKGQALAAELDAFSGEGAEPLVESLSQEDQEQLRRLLGRMLIAHYDRIAGELPADGCGPFSETAPYLPGSARRSARNPHDG
jgi:DNA-binding MarR family transcriptional regulator